MDPVIILTKHEPCHSDKDFVIRDQDLITHLRKLCWSSVSLEDGPCHSHMGLVIILTKTVLVIIFT